MRLSVKKIIFTVLIVVALSTIAKYVGSNSGAVSAMRMVQQEASGEGMPTDFFGVKWLASTEELKRLRPNVQQESAELFNEQEYFLGRKAKVTYYVKNNLTLMFIITFSEQTSPKSFEVTQKSLIQKYGAMSALSPILESSVPQDCSERTTERFRIDHCMLKPETGPVEQIRFYRTNKI